MIFPFLALSLVGVFASLKALGQTHEDAPKSTRHRYGAQTRDSMLARGLGNIHLAGRKCALYTTRSRCATGTGLSRHGVLIRKAHVENEAGGLQRWTLWGGGLVYHGCPTPVLSVCT